MVWERILNIIGETLHVRPEDVQMDSSFFDDLGADSLEVYQIITAVEDEFSVEVSDAASGYMPQTAGALYNRLADLLGIG